MATLAEDTFLFDCLSLAGGFPRVRRRDLFANVPGSATQKALRYMYNPIKDTRSTNCYVSTLGSLDVHYSSGVANRFFYLLAEGSGANTPSTA